MSGYVVEIKPSARRTSATAGRWVNREGPRREFPSKAAAREWAAGLSGTDRQVWVQDTVPADPAPIDGYVVAGRRGSPPDAAGTQRGIPTAADEPS